MIILTNKLIIEAATEKALAITGSVVVLARLAKVSPEVFAKGLVDDDANTDYTAAITAELVKAEIVKAKEEREVTK